MNVFRSEIFGDIPEPNNFTELINLINSNPKNRHPNISLWRGQSDVSWPIHSGIYRRIINSNPSVSKTEESIMLLEEDLLEQARHKGFGSINGRIVSDIELLARLQHHGAATRLVDFSKNSLVALWFCVNSLPEKTGLLLGIHSEFVEGNLEGYLPAREETYYEFTKDLHSDPNPWFIEPPVVSPRISAQHAVFLFSDLSYSKTGSLKLPKDEHANLFIAISPELKKIARQTLIQAFDIREQTLFPDFDGFCLSNSSETNISEMRRW